MYIYIYIVGLIQSGGEIFRRGKNQTTKYKKKGEKKKKIIIRDVRVFHSYSYLHIFLYFFGGLFKNKLLVKIVTRMFELNLLARKMRSPYFGSQIYSISYLICIWM